ncbi:MAG: S8 family serine peptidase [Pyrinomonadaceae bacterium]
MLSIFMSVGFVVALLGANANAQGSKQEKYVKNELLVKFSRGTESNAALAAKRTMNAAVLETLGDLGWQRVRLPEGISVDNAIDQYSKLDGIEVVQPNFYYHLQVNPNDAMFGSLWGMTKISAPAAWDIATGSPTVVVANIDTGMRLTHEDLGPNIWTNPGEIGGNNIDDDGNGFIDDVNGWDFFFNRANPADEHGHGTHTGGTIGAVGNNLLGVVGVNWNVKIMAIKIYDATPTDTTSAMLINAYNYVRLMKERGVNIRVTNNSYGGCNEACGYDQATKDALDAMGNAGILNVFAAGNSGTNNDTSPFYPASYTSPSVLAVGGTDQNDNRIFNFGANSVDLAAPATGILSTTWGSDASYGNSSGTSMATPHVAGAAALLSALNPSLSVASLKATLMNSVDMVTVLNGMNKTGGRLNVDRALRNQTVCTFPTAMTVPTKGGVFTLNLAPGTNCDYFVRSTSNWIKMIGGSNQQFSGNGAVTFRVTVNPTITRTGTIKIGEHSLNLTQSRN